MILLTLTVWESEIPLIGDWCLENIGDWAFSEKVGNIPLKDYKVSSLTWRKFRYKYLGYPKEKKFLYMRIKEETDVMATILRWTI